ncbi:MAG: OsmC family protein [Acidobacteriota bacterium]|nr:OsmC family protein [Blastocatellia bacterium]MDW8239915.1 OsmC family protein [Acidobacteriota bacterium]
MDGELTITLEQKKDYEFVVRFDPQDGGTWLMDESPPLGNGQGPDAARVLAAAVGNCLSASLLFCLRKAKIGVQGMKTTVTTSLQRNEQGRLRIGGIRVAIAPEIDPADRERVHRCLELFEDYCVVTQSVRRGIDVQVQVNVS